MEKVPNPESIDRSALVNALKTKGIEDAETREMLIAWTERGEEMAMVEGTREAQIKSEMDRAALYEDAGLTGAAKEVLENLLNIVIANEPPSEMIEDYRNTIEYRISLLSE